MHDAVKASSEIAKSMGDPVMAIGIYPMMQLLDEDYLGVDADFSGIGGKMSSSDPKSKVDLLDGPATIHKKIAKAYCVPSKVEGNGILAFNQHILLPYSQLQSPDGKTAALSALLKDQTNPTIFRSFAEVIDLRSG